MAPSVCHVQAREKLVFPEVCFGLTSLERCENRGLVLIIASEDNDLVGGKKERMIRLDVYFITSLHRILFYVSADRFDSMFGNRPRE